MQLKQLKLAGFKSFVDPTVLTFPSPLVAVVGPNGCGKSNIIDAIRWVMGENSAKHLRGDSMIDVIFNGSSQRKAVGQAQVELVFDNSLGRALGPFTSYGEISVKRVLTRDGESTYYLNGARCRRRDVTDLFLGTGAGVRGYSIISQGDISRLIEAKPETLRAYLEEAAGVSKYKERRRETLTRIQHTRENLLRLADIREALAKQLQRLEKQGKTAERYLALKEEERLCRAEILAIKWRDLTKAQAIKKRHLETLLKKMATEALKTVDLQRQKDLLTVKNQDQEQQVDAIHKRFHFSVMAITRAEENLLQLQRENTRLEEERLQLQREHEKINNQILHYKNQEEAAKNTVTQLSDRLSQLKTLLSEQAVFAETAMQEQAHASQQYQQIRNDVDILKREIAHVDLLWSNNEELYQQTLIRSEKLAKEVDAMELKALEDQSHSLKAQKEACINEKKVAADALQTRKDQLAIRRAQALKIEQQVRQLRDLHHQKITEHAALTAKQSMKLTSNPHPIDEWAQKPRLVNCLNVEEKWQFAMEFVLADQLKALVFEETQTFFAKMHLLKDSGDVAVTLSSPTKKTNARACLADKIANYYPSLPINLNTIYTVETLEEAIALHPRLKPQESVITPEGFWLGFGFGAVPKSCQDEDLGLLARQQKIEILALQLFDDERQLQDLQKARDDLHSHLLNDETALECLQKNYQEVIDALQSLELKALLNEKSVNLAKNRLVALAEERAELTEKLQELAAKKESLGEAKAKYNEQWQQLAQEQEQLFINKNRFSENANLLKSKVEQLQTSLTQTTLEHDRATYQIQQMQEMDAREQERITQYNERLALTQEVLIEKVQTLQQNQEKLQVDLATHQALEKQLADAKTQLAEEKQALITMDAMAKAHQSSIKSLEDLIHQERLEEQSQALRIQALEEALKAESLLASDLLINIEDSLTPNLRETALSVIMEKIAKLGAINLAAIEEYHQDQAQKVHLDEQYQDLEEALKLLEAAIDKMDKETEARLMQTFEQVNALFQGLFPQLFGGGKAYLALTSNQILEAGVVVMAQPPGKRNSTIQLLSGGEKAMTALALVFALFQLNPSPFCMLDEVDAPLDDENVVRFCKMVKDMSKFVQFLFITHNKVTMELAEQLIGVTMREPGVSRLVTVDMVELEVC